MADPEGKERVGEGGSGNGVATADTEEKGQGGSGNGLNTGRRKAKGVGEGSRINGNGASRSSSTIRSTQR